MAIAAMDVGYSVLYALFSLCLIFPPTEFVSAGFTVSSIFSRLLGSEDLRFIEYHIRRTTLTLLVHSLIPLGYVMGLRKLNMEEKTSSWELMILAAILVPLGALALAIYWRGKGKWGNHPIANTLALYSDGQHWSATAADVNVQFRRVDKFATAANAYTRIVVTESWFMKVQPYTMKIAHQDDVQLVMVGSEEHALTHLNSNGGAQFLNLLVACSRPEIGTFPIRINSLEFGDLRDKLRRPVRNSGNVVVHQTLGERFLDVFKAQVMQNPRYKMPPGSPDLEACIGCTLVPANVKLRKLCEEECVSCNCRPMWCLACMGKWWASRQDQDQPNTWLGGRTPCPLCRSMFCMLDICLIETAT